MSPFDTKPQSKSLHFQPCGVMVAQEIRRAYLIEIGFQMLVFKRTGAEVNVTPESCPRNLLWQILLES